MEAITGRRQSGEEMAEMVLAEAVEHHNPKLYQQIKVSEEQPVWAMQEVRVIVTPWALLWEPAVEVWEALGSAGVQVP